MSSLGAFNNWSASLNYTGDKMPVLFMGHGSPMNAIEDNEFSREWFKVANDIPIPVAVLVISAHWLTHGTEVTAMEHPKTIHDFGGFPASLHEVQYPAPGSPTIAKVAKELITYTDVGLNHDWGLDHGAWSVVKQMYPKANIPVLQLSIDYAKPAFYHYELGKQLAKLREKGVLILGSGNLVHNLRMIAWDKLDTPGYGYDWAIEMHNLFNQKILSGDHQALIHYEKLSAASKLAIPTPDHYYPLMYALALQDKKDTATLFNNKLLGGSLNMTSVLFSQL
jgi:4,5-DOPA dioxygenase extradiol